MNFGLVTNFFRNELLLTLFEMSNFPQKIQFFLKLYFETCLNFCAKIQRYYTVFHPENLDLAQNQCLKNFKSFKKTSILTNFRAKIRNFCILTPKSSIKLDKKNLKFFEKLNFWTKNENFEQCVAKKIAFLNLYPQNFTIFCCSVHSLLRPLGLDQSVKIQ